MKTAVSLCIVALMPGLAPTAVRAKDAEPSEALMVARAAGFKSIRDVSPADVQASASIDAALLAQGTAIDELPENVPERTPRFLAWMPRDKADSSKVATELLAKIWTDAVSATLANAQVKLEQHPSAQKSDLRRYLSVATGNCKDCEMWIYAIDVGREPRAGRQPPFLGNADAYIWGLSTQRGEGHIDGYPWTDDTLTPVERIAFMRKLSGNLPAWIYVYIPPGDAFAGYPQLINAGRVLYFIDPTVQ